MKNLHKKSMIFLEKYGGSLRGLSSNPDFAACAERFYDFARAYGESAMHPAGRPQVAPTRL